MDKKCLERLNEVEKLVLVQDLDPNVRRWEQTWISPFVYLNSREGIIYINGPNRLSRDSSPSSNEFMSKIIDFIDGQFKFTKYVEGHFKIHHHNSSFDKCLMDLFKRLEQLYKNEINVTCYWYYEEDDWDMLEEGEDYSSIFKVPFNFIEVETL
jgi:hypothetical protein